MNFAFPKFLLSLVLLCSASVIFAQDGIVLTGPILTEVGPAPIEAEIANEQVETDFRLEVSEFEMVPKNNMSETLKLVKIYDTKQPLGNSYILHIKGRDKATIIDPGYNGPAIVRYLENENLKPDAILLTNGSFYRIASNAQFKDQWPNIAIGIGAKDAGMLTDPKANQSEGFGGITSPEPTIPFQGGERMETSSSMTWQVLDTPGFTPGSLSYQLDTKEKRLVFTGDFIYRDGIGGSQLPMGDAEAFDRSLEAFLEYAPSETLIYPGFGPNTTVGDFYANIIKDGEDGIDILAAGQTLSMPLTDKTSSVVYQNEIVEVYPTTTFVYSDFVIPRYGYPYYNYYYRDPYLYVGLNVWNWIPIRRPPPPPHHHHLHDQHHWYGSGYIGGSYPRPPRPGAVGPSGRPPRPTPGAIGSSGRPPRPAPGAVEPSGRPPRPAPGAVGPSSRPTSPAPGIDRPSSRPTSPAPGIDRPSGRPPRPASGAVEPSGRPPRPAPGAVEPSGRPTSPAPGISGGSRPSQGGGEARPSGGSRENRSSDRPSRGGGERRSRD